MRFNPLSYSFAFLLLSCLSVSCVSAEQSRIDAETHTMRRDSLYDVELAHTEGLEIPTLDDQRDSVLLVHAGYVVSYNLQTNAPNWVAWHLTPQRLVSRESRSGILFRADSLLPEANRVSTNDYSGSGYDRGHLCPSSDNRWHLQPMRECFLMSNMCPQDHNLNANAWNELEKKCRHWANVFGDVYIVCGPVYDASKEPRYIGREHCVRVPDSFFKVVLCFDKFGQAQAIGFLMQNDNQHLSLRRYAKNIDAIERLTGIDFFPQLDDQIEDKVEAWYEWTDWPM